MRWSDASNRHHSGLSTWRVSLGLLLLPAVLLGWRAAIRDGPGRALGLLADPRPPVQTAALGALEYHPQWRPGEAELVIRMAEKSPEAGVRAAAAYALAGVDTPELVDALAGFLRD